MEELGDSFDDHAWSEKLHWFVLEQRADLLTLAAG